MILGAPQPHGLLLGLRQILLHGTITLLAVVIAFSMPLLARYILYEWWPLMEADPNRLLATEIALASVLVLLLNVAKLAWDSRHQAETARRASLIHARDGACGWFARRRERLLVRRLPPSRDAFVLTLTGYETFVDPGSVVRAALETAYEVRVMLVNPVGEGIRKRVETLPADITTLSFHGEIEASIAYLTELRKLGKSVSLRFYDHEPFWKLVGLGDHVWVQHCHSGYEVSEQPEFVFALHRQSPREGLFVPFYMHFLRLWNEADVPEYDFDTNEVVYRDAAGNERSRAPLGIPIDGGRGTVRQ